MQVDLKMMFDGKVVFEGNHVVQGYKTGDSNGTAILRKNVNFYHGKSRCPLIEFVRMQHPEASALDSVTLGDLKRFYDGFGVKSAHICTVDGCYRTIAGEDNHYCEEHEKHPESRTGPVVRTYWREPDALMKACDERADARLKRESVLPQPVCKNQGFQKKEHLAGNVPFLLRAIFLFWESLAKIKIAVSTRTAAIIVWHTNQLLGRARGRDKRESSSARFLK